MIFLSPHNDDETLFGAFTLLRCKPHVIVCYRDPSDWVRRENETDAAMALLGCSWEQWPFSHVDYEDPALARRMLDLHPRGIFAPAVEPGGQEHHNHVGQIASQLWPKNVVKYLTYTRHGGKSTNGSEVYPEYEWWWKRKQQALECYVSQRTRPLTAAHFERSQEEYYAAH